MNTRTNKRTTHLLGLAFFLFLTTPREATSSPVTTSSCLHITAALTSTDYGFYFFAGNQYAYYHPMLAMSAMTNSDSAARVCPISDIEGLSPEVEVTAAYTEPQSTQEVRLFDKNFPTVYRVDLIDKKVLETASIDSMFSDEELAPLKENGIQAAAILGQDRYFFSGCNVLKTNFDGNHEIFSLTDIAIPCDVDSAFAYPQKDAGHLLITKDAEAYGWFVGSGSTSYGYYMFCAAKVFTNIALNLCDCE